MPTFRIWRKGWRPQDGYLHTGATRGQAKYRAWRIIADMSPDFPYTDLRSKKISDADLPTPAEQLRAEEEKRVAQWNHAHPVGTAIKYWPGTRHDPARSGHTRSIAWVVGGHTAMVLCTGYAGAIALSHVEAVEEAP